MAQIIAQQFVAAARQQTNRNKQRPQTLEEMIAACGVGYFSLTRPKHWEAHYEDPSLKCTGAGKSPYEAVSDLLRALKSQQPED